MTSLVTGGAGFIGSHLVEALVARGERVRVLDNFATGFRGFVSSLEGVEVVEGDVRSYHVVREAVDGVEVVYHLAALPSVPRSIRDPITTNEVNTVGTLNLLNASRDATVRRLIHASSSSVYGKGGELPRLESMTPVPLSPYAVSKLAAEHYCRAFWDLYRLETIALRLFNVFGPRQTADSPYAGVVPRFIRALEREESPRLYGGGSQTRDFTFVADVVDAFLAAGTVDGAGGLSINVAAGVPRSVRDLLAAVSEIMGVVVTPVIEPPRVGEVPHSWASIELAGRILGFQPKVGFVEGLRRTIAAAGQIAEQPAR